MTLNSVMAVICGSFTALGAYVKLKPDSCTLSATWYRETSFCQYIMHEDIRRGYRERMR